MTHRRMTDTMPRHGLLTESAATECWVSTQRRVNGADKIAAVQGAEDGPLKKVAPMYQSQTGITMEVVEFPYDQLFEKLVTTFQANGSSYDLCMMDDPWMPKFGTMGALQPLDSNFGFTRDSDIPSIVYDVGTWPPPKGPVPPSEQGKTQHLYGITIVGNVEMFMYRKDLATSAPVQQGQFLRLRHPRQGHQPGEQRLAAHPLVLRR